MRQHAGDLGKWVIDGRSEWVVDLQTIWSRPIRLHRARIRTVRSASIVVMVAAPSGDASAGTHVPDVNDVEPGPSAG